MSHGERCPMCGSTKRYSSTQVAVIVIVTILVVLSALSRL